MDQIFFVIVLLTGFCVIPVSSTLYYYLVKRTETFNEAFDYCWTRYDSFPTIKTMSTNNFMQDIATNKTDKVWFGLVARCLPWTGLDGQPAKYFNWASGQPDGWIDELCATVAYNGEWHNQNCSLKRRSVCSNGGGYTITETEMTWTDAVANCKALNSSLVQIQNSTMNNDIMNLLSNGTEVWIGTNRSLDWYWADTGESATFLNWQEGQPDNLKGSESCVTMVTEDGTWTDERCDNEYYFYCVQERITSTQGGSGSVQKSKQSVVKLKIQTTANMKHPGAVASLNQQLYEKLAKWGLTNVKLSWRKLPEKETQS